jgi:hypothetical protein
LLIILPLFGLTAGHVSAEEAVDLGSRRELMVDDYVTDTTEGGATLKMHNPSPQDIAIVHDAPWEGCGSGYHTVFKDGDKYRM